MACARSMPALKVADIVTGNTGKCWCWKRSVPRKSQWTEFFHTLVGIVVATSSQWFASQSRELRIERRYAVALAIWRGSVVMYVLYVHVVRTIDRIVCAQTCLCAICRLMARWATLMFLL